MQHEPATVDSPCSTQLARLGGAYFHNLVRLVSDAFDRDIAVSVTFFAISRAARSGSRTGRADISGRQIAQALDLPYETVRRHVRKLRQAGLCQTGPDGVTATAAFPEGEQFRKLSDQVWLLGMAFARGPAAALMRPDGMTALTSPPDRSAVTRASCDFLLDSLTLGRRRLDLTPVECAVLAAVGVAEEAEAPRGPISAYAAAKTLSLPYETIRRTILHLTERGLVERGPSGAFALPTGATGDPAAALTGEFAALTRALLARLLGPEPPTAAG